MAIETNRRIFYPNLEIEDQLEAAGVDHLKDVTGRFPDELLPPSRERWQIGNLNADLTDLEIPTKLLMADDWIVRTGYIDLKNDQQMSRYGSAMSWAYPFQFLKEFPARVITIIVPNQPPRRVQFTRTDADYIDAARRVFESLYSQNYDRILGAEFMESENGDEELAGIYLNMGEYDYIYPRDGYLDDEDRALVELYNQRFLPPISSSSFTSPDVSSRSASTSLFQTTSEGDELSISDEDFKYSSPAPASSQIQKPEDELSISDEEFKSSSPAPASPQTLSPELHTPIPKQKFTVVTNGYYRSTG
ncbi:MAG: hypothetical protein KF898_09320 [Parachlamydiales bacterium]|nr:hypothetical protein [Verrucomicrobiota bacterium]MBX3719833.1 hypothetical protein [Candidatus Acheromyda pituitae]